MNYRLCWWLCVDEYINVEFKGYIKNGKEKELRQAITELSNNSTVGDVLFSDSYELVELFFSGSDRLYNISLLGTAEKYGIRFCDNLGFYYKSDAFISFLNPFLESQDVWFKSNSGDCWGYRLDGHGGIKRLLIKVIESKFLRGKNNVKG